MQIIHTNGEIVLGGGVSVDLVLRARKSLSRSPRRVECFERNASNKARSTAMKASRPAAHPHARDSLPDR